MRFRSAVGFVLFVPSVVAVVQTAREVLQSFGSSWTESPMVSNAFTFAGRAITIVKPTIAAVGVKSPWVQQERVRIDGIDVGEATDRRMSTWPFQADRRSPHWFDAVKFVDRAGRDSSLWIARRLQVADTVRPRFEIITIDAAGQHHVQMRAQNELRGEFRLRAVTALVAEDPRPEFPLSVVDFIWFPYLWLAFPIGTGLLGVLLLRPPRARHGNA